MLYIVGTPIGNLGDITLRALETLRNVDFICAEDTRVTAGLLAHFDIKKPLISYYEHNKLTRGPQIAERLKKGENGALVTDAGMPGISDPGGDMIRLCIENDLDYTVVPGPVAFVTGAVLSGLPTEALLFLGFMPENKGKQADFIKRIVNSDATVVLYESPYNLKKTLSVLQKNVPERRTAVVRELTKIYEEARRGSLGELADYYNETEPRGEFVIVIDGSNAKPMENEQPSVDTESAEFRESVKKEVTELMEKNGLARNEALRTVGKKYGLGRNEIYKIVNGD